MSNNPAWRTGVLTLADQYFRAGHVAENKGDWTKADAYRDVYSDLCSLIARLDPRPGGGDAPKKPW